MYLKFGRRGLVQGLNDEAVKESRRRYGENVLTQKKGKGFFRKLLENFGDPLIKILLIALGINVIFLFKNSEWYETAIIAAAILIATVVSTVSELGSEAAFKRLQTEAACVVCKAVRGGGLVALPVAEIVVGDCIKLQAGDRIPADGYLEDGGIEVDQSSLNGESKEAEKTAAPTGKALAASCDFLDKHRLFLGTVVCSGEGLMRVTAVGDKTFYGNLAGELQDDSGASPLKERLNDLAKSISRFGYVGAALVAMAYLFNAFVAENSFDPNLIRLFFSDWQNVAAKLLYAVTLAVTVIVMAVPEGLPMMITVVLTSNMKKMMKDNVIVRKLVGIETAGSLNILFCDKTGTLTGGKLKTYGFLDGGGALWTDGKLSDRPIWRELHRSLYYNNSAAMSDGAAIGGNSTDRALLEYACKSPVKESGIVYTVVAPFSSELKYMATEIKSGTAQSTLVKGAPEVILPHCKYYIDAWGHVKSFNRRIIESKIAELQKKAFRLIAVATKEGGLTAGGFEGLKLVGVMIVRDDIRP
ncbi:MAG: ATPase P, partial [Clostridiales bacterium]|nr:ATPase P [Clostridiales bacterium]